MIVPYTSAILAIFLSEGEVDSFRDRICKDGGTVVSVGTAVELASVARRDDDLCSVARALLGEPFIFVEPLIQNRTTHLTGCTSCLKRFTFRWDNSPRYKEIVGSFVEICLRRCFRL